jgi:hypothetical protein
MLWMENHQTMDLMESSILMGNSLLETLESECKMQELDAADAQAVT